MKPRLKVAPPKSPPMDKDRAREQIAASKLTPSEALIVEIRKRLERLYITTSRRGSVHFGADEYGPQQFADEVRDLLERTR